MIVGFREFEGQFSSRLELCVGAVLVSPDGVQYERVKRSDYGAQWRVVGGQGGGCHVSIARMRELVDASCGGIEVGNGQGVSRVRAFMARERAEKVIKNMDRWGGASSYRVVEYKMCERNM